MNHYTWFKIFFIFLGTQLILCGLIVKENPVFACPLNSDAIYCINLFEVDRDFSSTGKPKVYLVNHDPKGPTYNHDYFSASAKPFTKDLLRMVESAHTNKILLSLRKSYAAPPTLVKGFQKSALADTEYTLERIVNHPRALILSQMVATAINKPRLPIKYYERALAHYPQYAITHAQYGNFLVEIGEIEAGIKRLKKAIQLDPKLSSAYGWLSNAYQKDGKEELAREFAEKAKALGYKRKLDVEK